MNADARAIIATISRPLDRDLCHAMRCPITSHAKGYPFEVSLPAGLSVTGVVLADQVKSLDWRVRDAVFAGRLPGDTSAEVVGKLASLLEG